MAKKDEIVADLKDLLETDTTRSKIGRIWEIFDEIVQLQQGGVSMKNIEARLNIRGFGLKPGNLSSYLYQIKKKKGIQKVAAPVAEPKPKLERPKGTKAATGKSPAAPDLMDGTKTEEKLAAPIIEKKDIKQSVGKPITAQEKTKSATVDQLKEVTRGHFDPNQFNDDSE